MENLSLDFEWNKDWDYLTKVKRPLDTLEEGVFCPRKMMKKISFLSALPIPMCTRWG